MKRFFLSDILYGLVLTLIFVSLYLAGGSFLETAELKFYDIRSRMRLNPEPGKELALIVIDDDSLSKIGRWPWPRSKIAGMIELLSAENTKPAVIGLNILFPEQEKNPGLAEIENLKQKYVELVKSTGTPSRLRQRAGLPRKLRAGLPQEYLVFAREFDEAKLRLDNDMRLSSAIASAENVVLPMYFVVSPMTGGKPRKMPAWVNRFALQQSLEEADEMALPLAAAQATIPFESITSSAAGVGHVNMYPDSDGTVRREFMSIFYDTDFYPSFAVEIVRNYMGLESADINITPGKSLNIGSRRPTAVPTDSSSAMLVTFNGPDRTFRYYSFFDVLNGKIPLEIFKNKIVLIGPTAVGLGTLYVTPVAHNFPGVEVVANVVENLLHKRFLLRPQWASQAEILLIVIIGLFITFALPRLKALMGAVLSSLLLAGLLGAGMYFFVESQWLKTTYPALLLAAGYILITSKRFFVTEKKKELVEASAIETNKMLGLSFQGQGMLDLAFEKFRICPIDNPMKDLLYNLGLDLERKRQHNKAVAVYEHLATKDSSYKDIRRKIEMLKKAADGAVFGTAVGKSKESTLLMEGSATTPTLGRYEITRELGKGAMGIVYLGRDPKINRQVAIKTMRFEEDIDEKAMKEIKFRFFREAQAAGNLSHPNIIKIYDAGEEQEIAYIAMELLKGEDLKKWTSRDSLLPIEKVTEYICKSADALGYAHSQGVVHRDIKPANIMLLGDGSIRVTDFGIARIQASSKTATGTVLGTPYYMSPEQISGKKVDGRADIFSLGVTLFELLTGEKPWKGGESIGALLYQIANEPHPDPMAIRPDIPAGFAPIIEKALKKNADERYQKAEEMAADIRSLKPAQVQPVPRPTQVKPAPKPAPVQPAPKPAQVQPAPKPVVQPAPKPVVQPAPVQPAPAQQVPPAAQTKPDSIERPPLSGVQSPAKKPEQPQPAPSPKPETQQPQIKKTPDSDKETKKGLDFEKTLPIIYPDNE